MRQRQDEIFGERVKQAEGHVVVMVLAVDRLFFHVEQGVVHPPHVPFVGKTESPTSDRPAHARPRRRFLGDHDRAGTAFGDDRIEMTEKEMASRFLAAMNVRNPFALFAAVVAIQH